MCFSDGALQPAQACASDLGNNQSRYLLVVSTSAIDCLERLISEMTCYVEWAVKPYTLGLICSVSE